MRKSIFQILEDQFDLHKEIERINEVFEKDLFCKILDYSPEQLVDQYIFVSWKQRNRCINTTDMKESLSIEEIVDDDNPDLQDVLIFLEYVENILNLAWNYMCNNDDIKYYSDYTVLRKNIDSLLDNINHQTYFFDDEEMVLIYEKNAEATAVADIIEPKLGVKVIKYNHYLLKGDINAKKDVILALASKLEPKRKQLQTIDKTLTSNLFYMLNNLNLRHNNTSQNSKTYKNAVAKMRKDTLEKWYDEVYQLELLAFLLLDNVKRNQRIVDLKTKLEEQTNDK